MAYLGEHTESRVGKRRGEAEAAGTRHRFREERTLLVTVLLRLLLGGVGGWAQTAVARREAGGGGGGLGSGPRAE